MGDTVSIGVLLPPLERICAEHRAMVLLLKESTGGPYWRADVTHLCEGSVSRQTVQGRFIDVHNGLQSGDFEENIISHLVAALNKVTLE
jgi:hypothetical protein